jgi:hypothetical protein
MPAHGDASSSPAALAGLSLAVSGHRSSHPALVSNSARIEAAIARVFDIIDDAVAAAGTARNLGASAPTRLHCMLVDGVDQMTTREAAARGWSVAAPLPFGQDLNLAINAQPRTATDARALLRGGEAKEFGVNARAQAIRELAGRAHVFELAEKDELVAELFLRTLRAPGRNGDREAFELLCSERVALAARVMLEQSDILVGVWDGATEFKVGGTGHTIATALEMGAAVVWIDANHPDTWHILRAPEALGAPMIRDEDDRVATLSRVVGAALSPPDKPFGGDAAGTYQLDHELWRPASHALWHAFRRVEAMFDDGGYPFRSVRQTYESPEEIGARSGAGVLAAARALPGGDAEFPDLLEARVLRPFAWFDGVSSHLSDKYRAGMTLSFILAAVATVSGIAYQPLASDYRKWLFALVEFILLVIILLITAVGQRQRWHGRWFETRRVAEYLRHAPTVLMLGIARPPGRWPRGVNTSWPEYYARRQLRSVGLPRVAVRAPYLRAALECLLNEHVAPQRDYHLDKARRLSAVHRRLDKLSGRLFQMAVASVAAYLAVAGASAAGLTGPAVLEDLSKTFTFLGVLFPTSGGMVAGIRYFGDFERFAAISEVTAEKLDAVAVRIRLLLTAPDSQLDYPRAAELSRLTDDIVFSEIENWQAVFGGKHTTIPV